MVLPIGIMNLSDLSGFLMLRVNSKLSLNQVRHQLLLREKDQTRLAIFEMPLLLDLHWPILLALRFAAFLQRCEHYNQVHMLLLNHTPEVLLRCLQRSLSCNKQRLAALGRNVDIIRIDVRVVNVFCSLLQSHSAMLD